MPLRSLSSLAGCTPPLRSLDLSFDPLSCPSIGAYRIAAISPRFGGSYIFGAVATSLSQLLGLGQPICLVVADNNRTYYGRLAQICAVGASKVLFRVVSDLGDSYLLVCEEAACELPLAAKMRKWFMPSKWLAIFQFHTDVQYADVSPLRPYYHRPPAPKPSFVTLMWSSTEDWVHAV
ncbi:uncharacterized protein B0H18DRAFT_1125664 [Fomitopsis serialis]|uniref:uncharacterized protein n=1 Tax=Fomitopsis serialis TaxID=139415 RepID=UPI00200752F7|nr:uncharacterized protein B0H18DRAFT_1125664 [Neoantrodia serialis]KAH9914327.1 hypothetical protein B0H18DRAFT_1125664 [Neoantrodia serialis]